MKEFLFTVPDIDTGRPGLLNYIRRAKNCNLLRFKTGKNNYGDTTGTAYAGRIVDGNRVFPFIDNGATGKVLFCSANTETLFCIADTGRRETGEPVAPYPGQSRPAAADVVFQCTGSKGQFGFVYPEAGSGHNQGLARHGCRPLFAFTVRRHNRYIYRYIYRATINGNPSTTPRLQFGGRGGHGHRRGPDQQQ
jgi:hypothetical protein